jgi:hypothetical protein
MRRTRKPAVLKQNRYGTRWFQSMPGDRDPNYKPESAAHEMTKIWLVEALRMAGYHWAEVERYGTTPDGNSWEADVYLETNGQKIAIEIQLSRQSLEDYLYRTERYRQSGVKVVWLVRHYFPYCVEASRYKGFAPFIPPKAPDLLQVPALELELRCSLDEPKHEAIRVKVLYVGERGYRTISLIEFATGLANGRLRYREKQCWQWDAS